MNYTDKIKYIHKYLSGELNSLERGEFNAWSLEDENKLLIQEISSIWNSSKTPQPIFFDAKKAFDKHKDLLDKTNVVELPTKKNQIFKLIAVVAILIILLVSLFVFDFNKVTKDLNSKEKVIYASLEDGTEVWLDKGSSLQVYEFTKDKRVVSLSGRAYFDVAQDKATPFIIQAGSSEVKVLGTKFLVDENIKEVFVKEGRVEVKNREDSKTIILTDNQSVKLSEGKFLETNNKPFDQMKLWFNRDLKFDNTPFDKVLVDIETRFNVIFEVDEIKDWSKCTFTSGSLSKNTIDQILNTLQLTYELVYVKLNPNTYRLSSIKCE